MTVVSPRNLHPASRQGSSDVGLTAAVTLFAALLVALVTRGNIVVGLVVLFLVFVPLERIFALHPRRVFRPGIVTDLTHLLANTTLVTIGTIALVVVAALPLLWLRAFDVEGALPTELSLALAVVVASIANYWGHRLTHEVPFLWRFHAVHHSIELMDWAAAADCTRSTPRSPRRSPCFPCSSSATTRESSRRRRVRHAPRDLPARQRALAVPGRAVDRQHAGVAPLAPRTTIPKLGTRTSVCPSSTSCSGPRTSRRAGDRRRSASTTRSRPTGYLAHLAYPFTGAAQPPARPALLHEAFE